MSEQGEDILSPPQSEGKPSKIARILALDIEQFPEFRQQSAFAWQRDGSRYALHTMQDALRRGYLNLDDFAHVIDFGAGGGGPTFLLDQICKIIGGRVEALENDPDQLRMLRSVVPSVSVHTGNGLDELTGRNGTVSLVTAFTFGPDYEGEFFPKLADASSKALSRYGKLLTFSDARSAEHMFSGLRMAGISDEDAKIIPAQNTGNTYKHIPQTLILSKQGASMVK